MTESTGQSRELAAFYNKIREQLKDANIDLSERPAESAATSSSKDHNSKGFYGDVSKSVMGKFLLSYDQRQNDGPILHNKVLGKSYQKYLFSRPGFHNPGASDYLINDLGILDPDRISFLNGLSSLKCSKDSDLKAIKANELACRLNDCVKRAQKDNSKTAVDEGLKLDPNNPELLAIRGKFHLKDWNLEYARSDLKKALEGGLQDPAKAEEDLSETHCSLGLRDFLAERYEQAQFHFLESLKLNKDHDNAKLHLSMCETKLMHRRTGGAWVSSYGRRG